MTRRNLVGVGTGISAVPNDTNTLLNAFYLTVEPQLDIVNTTYNWRLGLGAPLAGGRGDAVVVVFNVEQHGQFMRGRPV
jgi:hypothetical protein